MLARRRTHHVRPSHRGHVRAAGASGAGVRFAARVGVAMGATYQL